MSKKTLGILLGSALVIAVVFVLFYDYISQRKHRVDTTVEAGDIARGWLKHFDPSVFERCVVTFENVSEVTNMPAPTTGTSWKGDYFRVDAEVCGKNTSFWVIKNSGLVNGFIEYKGEDAGKVRLIITNP